ncbi:MAG TPA: tetratricopeptide repeat protein, partial [Gemmatimonadaceae bacterium]|nr:tetratricopeptide repeat protein [Gemmatimonadaceae bacterium]
MAPEQAAGDPAANHRADIYSAGAVAYEMLSGERLFADRPAHAIMAAHALDVPASLTGKTRGIPPALADLIAKCLEKDPARRPQTEQEVLQSLDAIRQGSGRRGFGIPSLLLASGLSGRKRTPLRILAALLALALIYGGYRLTAQRVPTDTNVAKPKAPLTIAVLPFENMSGSRENEYFSDGMTDELIQALGTVKGLEVAARTSSFAVKGKNLTVQEIGEKLHVSHVIDGSVRGSSKRLRVSAALISTGDGYRVWSETYDRDPKDVFQVQDDIAQSIVSALRSTLGNTQPASGAHRMPRDLAAYDLYLKGRYFWNKRTSAGLQTAANYFEQAIARDTTYALAYAGLADSYAVLAAFGYLEPKQAYAKAKPAALKAIALDSTLAEAHTSLGFTHLYYDLDPASAKREFDRAIALDPRYATAHLFNAWYYLVTGEFDNAIHEVEIAREIEPLSLIINTRLGTTERYAGRYDEAEKQLRKTLELDANFPVALDELARILASRGNYKEASVNAQRAADLGYVHGPGILGYALAMSGNRASAERIVNALIAKSKSEYVAPFDIGMIYTGLGNDSAAIEWLSRCKEVRDHEASHLRFDPLLKRLRRVPRFVAITSTSS